MDFGPLSSDRISFWIHVALPFLTKQGRPCMQLETTQVAMLIKICVLAFTALSAGVALICVWSSAAPAGGCAWGKTPGKRSIPGPKGWPVLGSLMEMGPLAHRHLAYLAKVHNAQSLMAFSIGSTRVIISSKPDVAREILNISAFADRPLKQSAQQLLFGRAIGFAPHGEYWRRLRRIAANHLFHPKRIAAHEALRQLETSLMIESIERDALKNAGVVALREYLQAASLNNIMASVFGCRYNFESMTARNDFREMVREGFDLLGTFNLADHLPALQEFDPQCIHRRCAKLVRRVYAFVQNIINEHRRNPKQNTVECDFVDVLLSLEGDDKLNDGDIVAILWEMIFRGTDATAILAEWAMAELVVHPEIQMKAQEELDSVLGKSTSIHEVHILKMPYLQAIIKETLRMHPPGPLLSWARLSNQEVTVAGHKIPKGTTAMVNMWSITHDPLIWSNPEEFNPDRFMTCQSGEDIDVRGTDLRLAPFGAGRRVCPGRGLGLATVHLWLASLLYHYRWLPSDKEYVDLSEVLKLSCEMASPLKLRPLPRAALVTA